MKRLWIVLLICLLVLSLSGCVSQETTAAPAMGDELTVWFLDVGQADAAVLQCGGQTMMIDGGNAADSDYIYAWLQNNGITTIDTMVCTHAHEDHVGGLSGALAYANVEAAYAPVTQAETKVFQSFVHQLETQAVSLSIPSPGDTICLGDAKVEFLGPVEAYTNVNNTSLVLRVDYGQTSFLFTGDMEKSAEQDLMDSGAYLAADVLKVGHHGGDTSSGADFLAAVAPDYAVISVGANNDYGHPRVPVLQRLQSEGANVYRTDLLGTICCKSDGQTVTVSFEKTVNETAAQQTQTQGAYIGNVNSKKFHLPSCSGLPEMQNQIHFATRQDAVQAGYTPCVRCKP